MHVISLDGQHEGQSSQLPAWFKDEETVPEGRVLTGSLAGLGPGLLWGRFPSSHTAAGGRRMLGGLKEGLN